MNEKAYKLLAAQEGVSNGEAKRLIDDGFVFVNGSRLTIARAEIDAATTFKVEKPKAVGKIFDDGDMTAIDKPRGMESYELEKRLKLKLIHRLDKETSGVLCFAKSDEFLAAAIAEFRALRVVKRYLAVVDKVVAEETTIEAPVLTFKGTKAKSVIDASRGKEAKTRIKPLLVEGRRTLLEVSIDTGRTHQIRVHLAHINMPILGDESYGGKPYKRLMLHSSFISLLGREISCEPPQEFTALFGKLPA
ncbi:putative RNA pseudouridine synthase [Campylobacterota bacterium]|nr:putative RNA pseudouridine synthase [Campylobacterota bacterium]